MRLVTLPLVALLFTGCSSYLPLGFKPGDRREIEIKTQEVTMYLEPLKDQGSMHVFDLEVINDTPYPIELNPGNIRYATSNMPFTNNNVPVVNAPVRKYYGGFCKNPGSVVQFFEQKAKSDAVAAAIFKFAVAAAVVYVSTNTKPVKNRSEFIRKKTAYDVTLIAAQVATTMANSAVAQSQETSQRLPYEVFPEGVIHSLSNQRGKIFFADNDTERYLRIFITIREQEYSFDFELQKEKKAPLKTGQR